MSPNPVTRRPPSGASNSGERGASLAIVAVSLVWIVGMASLVVDVGSGWLSRQTLVAATDAAALAAAQDLVDRPWDKAGACSTARTYVSSNAVDAAVTDCAVTSAGSAQGRVTVSVAEDLETNFSPLGPQDGSVGSVSTATWGPPLTVTGLRPFGLC
ncbi:MAG: pilus assembly protein TadG-related protein, partial [Acidimicrobiales bacterium]